MDWADHCDKALHDAHAAGAWAVRAVAEVVGESTACRRLFSKQRARSALLVGLDNAGKSSILCSLPQVRQRLQKFARDHGLDELRVDPTTALQLVKFTMARSSHHRLHRRAMVNWHVWDMSGEGRARPLWLYYCSLVQAIVFVVDVTDVERIAIARNELKHLFSHPSTRGLPLLVMANKTDVTTGNDESFASPRTTPRRIATEMLKGMLDLDALQVEHGLHVKLSECSAETGKGIEPAFQWLTDHVNW
ncbi:hypothetical protein CTAYLR_000461 [Chrysophaeum taylorii]|uniref:Uncharacterized protein n=1 Tax=Chrysophaeum taylorii TaxID=2483200 RepID=A0AAD7UIG9_9STRA|nr:hypothetical protein CTAYLR_000461 [Chrysophaeum taylorii]